MNTILHEKIRISFFLLVSLIVFSVLVQAQSIHEWLPQNEKPKSKIENISINTWSEAYDKRSRCIDEREFHQTNYTVPVSAHNQVWQPGSNGFTTTNDNVIYLNGYVRIPPGLTLTLKNFTLKFNDTSYVEIARGVNASS